MLWSFTDSVSLLEHSVFMSCSSVLFSFLFFFVFFFNCFIVIIVNWYFFFVGIDLDGSTG